MPDPIVPILTLTASAGALVCIILFLLWKAKGMADFPTLSFILCTVTIFAAGFILVSAWFGLSQYNLGKPATSLEPGVYEIFGLGGTSDELHIAYHENGQARLVKLDVENLDPETQIKPGPAGGRRHQVTYVTRCVQKNICETRILISPVPEKP